MCYTIPVKTKKTKEEKTRYIEGIISISHKGVGRVKVNGADEIVEVEHSFLRTACHGDTVKVLLHPKVKDEVAQGEVFEILRRSKIGYAGVLEKENS